MHKRSKLHCSTNRSNKHNIYSDGKKSISHFGAGDSFYIADFIKAKHVQDDIFRRLLHEIDFVPMFTFSKDNSNVTPIPRLVQAQTCKTGSCSAIYRMPGCNQSNINTSNWTEAVREVVDRAKESINDNGLNHCMCILYRDETDSLAFHMDKLLDLEEDSLILSISFGSPRPIVFKEMNGKQSHTILLRPGSLLAIGKKTNTRWQHTVPKLDVPTGPRISLSIRHIASFIEVDDNTGEYRITGKGKEYQTCNYPFAGNHDDPDQYTDDAQIQIDKFTRDALEQLQNIRLNLPLLAKFSIADNVY